MQKPQNGRTFVTVRQNRLARFRSGEVAYWKVENRPIPGQKKGALAMTGQDLLVLDVPDQGDKKDLIVSYEVCVYGLWGEQGSFFAQSIYCGLRIYLSWLIFPRSGLSKGF